MNTIPIEDQETTKNHHNNNSSRSTTKISISSSGQPTPLGPYFQPGQYDCICGRGKVAYNHVGNKWVRSIINTYKHDYEQAYNSKIQRSCVVTKILHIVRSYGTGFVKQERNNSTSGSGNGSGGEWIEIGDVLGTYIHVMSFNIFRLFSFTQTHR